MILAGTLNRMADELGARIREVREDRVSRDLILSSMEEGVVLIEGSDEVGYANPAATRMLGGVPTAIAGLWPHMLQRLVAEARSQGSIREEEMETGVPGRRVRVSAVPVGTDERVLLVLRDVTEARRLEAMRRDFVANPHMR